jgi:hypothetical protein
VGLSLVAAVLGMQWLVPRAARVERP